MANNLTFRPLDAVPVAMPANRYRSENASATRRTTGDFLVGTLTVLGGVFAMVVVALFLR